MSVAGAILGGPALQRFVSSNLNMRKAAVDKRKVLMVQATDFPHPPNIFHTKVARVFYSYKDYG